MAVVSAWYLTRGSLLLGAAVSSLVGLLVLLGHQLSITSDHPFAWGSGTFLLGWLVQFLGHWYEGKKPVVADDLRGWLVAPMFITAEALFSRGWNPQMQAEIERRAGPTFLRDMAI